MTLRLFSAALAALAFAAGPAAAQTIYISEADTRTSNLDSAEFIELYNPNTVAVDLSDYVIVLYNGATNGVYATYNLDGEDIAPGDYFVLCGDATEVANCDRSVNNNGFIQQGPDAIALYLGEAADFENGQQPGDENPGVELIDAVVYGASNNVDQDLIVALDTSSDDVDVNDQFDENANGKENQESLQRAPNATSATFAPFAPTPGVGPSGTPGTPLPPSIDIDEARDEPLGTLVTVEGIVTRTEGDFLFLEDDTAALFIRIEDDQGPAADLRQDVEDEVVVPGTVLSITGRTSQRGQVIQIENDDLTSYAVGETGQVPAPQTVTLAQIAANGERYESELVRVRDLSFSDDGTFTASRSYDVNDGTFPQSDVDFFLPDAGNTRIEGTPIPDAPTDVVGIVNQSGFIPTSGYRLLGIDPADIGGNATEPGNTGDPDVALYISEIDPSQAGADTGEFVELYNDEDTAVSLDGYALVFFSGANDRSYQVIDLDDETVPAGGFFVLCADDTVVDNCDLEVDGFEGIVNGPAAVALYAGSDVDFPDGTATSTTNLVDAVVYSTSAAANDTGLLTGLGVTQQVNEDLNSALNDESIQRLPVTANTFQVAAPTPGALPVEGPMEVTLAEARALGAGEEVTIEGTVSRAMGSFVYLQDATGGIAIRQTSGDFFDAVAAGDIAPGTVVRVTGTLSEFRNLLQINEGDLTDFETLGSGDAPNPVLVTLAQLAQNGEAFEGELVAVTGVTFEATSGEPFTAATTYTVSDGSSASGAVTVRVPNAADTMIDGELVPSGPVTVIGVVGQFDSSDDGVNQGYQLLVIDATDVNPNAVANERGPVEGLDVALANPVRGAATVTFSTPAAGAARLAVYDALGRRVAVLADGPVAAGAHTATLDAASMAPGVYVLRLEAEGGAVTRTVTVVR